MPDCGAHTRQHAQGVRGRWQGAIVPYRQEYQAGNAAGVATIRWKHRPCVKGRVHLSELECPVGPASTKGHANTRPGTCARSMNFRCLRFTPWLSPCGGHRLKLPHVE